MRRTSRRMLQGISCALLICLVASIATTVVFANEPYWGDLKVGDEMRWHWDPGFAGSYTDIYYEIKILAIQEDSLKVDHNQSMILGGSGETRTYKREIATFTYDELKKELYEEELMQELYWIYPASLIQANKDIKTRTYEYDGSNYKAAYIKEVHSEVEFEFWWDYGTGILCEYNRDPTSTGPVGRIRLEYTNADLTEPTERRFCFGSIFITFVSITMLISYSLVRYQKKKKP